VWGGGAAARPVPPGAPPVARGPPRRAAHLELDAVPQAVAADCLVDRLEQRVPHHVPGADLEREGDRVRVVPARLDQVPPLRLDSIVHGDDVAIHDHLGCGTGALRGPVPGPRRDSGAGPGGRGRGRGRGSAGEGEGGSRGQWGGGRRGRARAGGAGLSAPPRVACGRGSGVRGVIGVMNASSDRPLPGRRRARAPRDRKGLIWGPGGCPPGEGRGPRGVPGGSARAQTRYTRVEGRGSHEDASHGDAPSGKRGVRLWWGSSAGGKLGGASGRWGRDGGGGSRSDFSGDEEPRALNVGGAWVQHRLPGAGYSYTAVPGNTVPAVSGETRSRLHMPPRSLRSPYTQFFFDKN